MVYVKILNKSKIVISFVLLSLCVLTYISVNRYIEDYTSEFIDKTLYSSVLNESRKIFIRLPKNYDKSKAYPLIIKTDGNFNLSRWDESISRLSTQRKIEDSIVVAIPNLFWTDSRNRDLVPPYARRNVNIEARPLTDNDPSIFGRADLFLQFIETEVLPYIESTYLINQNRVLSGFSAGGSFVLYAIVTNPNLFTGYFAFSPAAWYDNSVVVDEFKKQLVYLNNKTQGRAIFLYLSLGEAENDMITGSFKGLLSAIEMNGPESLYVVSRYSKNAEHVDNPYISVPLALEAYYSFKRQKM